MTTPGSSPNGREEQGGMPMPASFGTSAQPADAGGMPRPSMGDAGTSGGMPRPGAAGDHAPNIAAGPESMPVPDDAASLMTEELPRFGPPGGAGGRGPRAGRRRGPVPLRRDAEPGHGRGRRTLHRRRRRRTGPDEPDPPAARRGAGRADLRHQRRGRHGRADGRGRAGHRRPAPRPVHDAALRAGRRHPGDRGGVEPTARRREAVPVPIALPPMSVVPRRTPSAPAPRTAKGTETHRPAVETPPAGNPLAEPITGSSTTVVVNPVTGLENQWYIIRCTVNGAWAGDREKRGGCGCRLGLPGRSRRPRPEH